MELIKDTIKQDNIKLFKQYTINYILEYPVYAHTETIFTLIYLYEATKIMNYFEKYLKAHPLNKITKGQYFESLKHNFEHYKFFILVQSNNDVTKIHKKAMKINEDGNMNLILCWKLTNLKCSSKIIETFRAVAEEWLDMFAQRSFDSIDYEKHLKRIKKCKFHDLITSCCGLCDNSCKPDLKHLSVHEKKDFTKKFRDNIAEYTLDDTDDDEEPKLAALLSEKLTDKNKTIISKTLHNIKTNNLPINIQDYYSNTFYANSFYFCQLGFCDVFKMAITNANLKKILKYFDKLNVKLRERIVESDVVYKPLLNIIADYTLY
jgi:hypothetical protein